MAVYIKTRSWVFFRGMARGGGEGLCNQPGLNTIWSLTTRSDSAESILFAEYNKLFFGCIKYFPLVRSIRRIKNSNITV